MEDLFYTSALKKKAFKNTWNEEYLRAHDVVSKYAIHNSGVAMTLKKVSLLSMSNRLISRLEKTRQMLTQRKDQAF